MSRPFIKDLREITTKDVGLVGGKAANLGEMTGGLAVPPGFCLTVEAYDQHLTRDRSEQKILGMLEGIDFQDIEALDKTSAEIRDLIKALPMDPEVERVLREAYERLEAKGFHQKLTGRPGFFVAVRSSATAEDRPDASFAGQQDTYLNVVGADDVLSRVKDCWASLWTSRAIHYRRQNDYDQEHAKMAVVIQVMLPAEIAGVMFTANPVSDNRGEILIVASRGLGESLVSGEVTGESYIYQKKGLVFKGVTGADPVHGPLFSDGQIKQLAHFGFKLEEYFECPQDVEWAYYSGTFYFLQTRPITSLSDETDEEVVWEKLTGVQKEILTVVRERFPEPIYPIDGAVTKIFFASQLESLEKLGYRVPAMDWTRVEKGVFPEFFIPPAVKPGWRQVFSFLKLPGVLKGDPAAEWRRESASLMKNLIFLKEKNLNRFPYEIVYEYLEDGLKELHLFLLYRYKFFARNRLPAGLLGHFLKLLFGSEAAEIHENLLAGIPCLTMETNHKLRELAQLAVRQPEVGRVLETAEPDAISDELAEVQGGPAYLTAFAEFMDVYGDRETTVGLGGLGVPTWRESPEVVWGILKGMVSGGIEADLAREEAMHRRRKEAEERLEKRLSSGLWALVPIKGLVRRFVSHNRSFAAFREDSHFDLARALAVFRVLFLELGARFTHRGLLDDPKDIMYLSYYEIGDTIMELYNFVQINVKVFRSRLEDKKAFYRRRVARWQARGRVPEFTGASLSGVPACSGTVCGPARIINSPADFHKLKAGDILVAPYTNPAWTPLFAAAAAIVSDTGGAASHAAIIAREYGIPAVMGVNGASKLIQDGELIEVNGTKGTVTKE